MLGYVKSTCIYFQEPKAGKSGGKSIKRSKSFSQGFLNQTGSSTDTLTRPVKAGTRYPLNIGGNIFGKRLLFLPFP